MLRRWKKSQAVVKQAVQVASLNLDVTISVFSGEGKEERRAISGVGKVTCACDRLSSLLEFLHAKLICPRR